MDTDYSQTPYPHPQLWGKEGSRGACCSVGFKRSQKPAQKQGIWSGQALTTLRVTAEGQCNASLNPLIPNAQGSQAGHHTPPTSHTHRALKGLRYPCSLPRSLEYILKMGGRGLSCPRKETILGILTHRSPGSREFLGSAGILGLLSWLSSV